MHKERLLLLADFLDTLPPEKFDYSVWVGRKWDGNPDLMACGTTACALGWATTIPELKAFGLHMSMQGFQPHVTRRDCVVKDLGGVCNIIFGIDEEAAHYLFVPSLYSGLDSKASAKDVAAHIRRFVETEGECMS